MPKMDESETLYEFYVEPNSHEWKIWEPPEWTFPKVGFEFANCLIPTRDSVRAVRESIGMSTHDVVFDIF